MNVEIPEALHPCPGCYALCEGEEYCAGCAGLEREFAERHAQRLAKLCDALPREEALPERRGGGGWIYLAALLIGAVGVKLCGLPPAPSGPTRAERFFRRSIGVAIFVAWAAVVWDIWRLCGR